MKKLDLYISKQFLTILILTVTGFITVFIIVDLIENLDRFIDNSVPGNVVVRYYIYALPWFINIALPMAMLMATVFSAGLMVKRNEWTAMKSTGISLYRLAVPLILIGLIVSEISFEFDNRLVSKGNEKRFEIERQYIKKKARKRYKYLLKDVFLQKKESMHISIGKYRTTKKSAESVTILNLENGKIERRLDAKEMLWVDSLAAWAVSDFSIRSFLPSGLESTVTISKGDSLMSFDFTPEDITKQSKLPEELNFKELTERIAQLKDSGVDTKKWEVTRHFKVSFAFTNLIVILFGFPLVFMGPKGGLSFGAGIGVFVIFAYYAFIKFGQSLGFKGVLEPLPAAWIGNVVFLIGGIILLLAARK